VGSFSQSFKLPLDDELKQLLGFVEKPGYIPQGTDIRENSTLFWKKRYPAALTWRAIPVVHGYIQFKGVTTTDTRVDVEGVFFAEQLNIAKQVGDKMLTDLDLSAYDHELNISNIQNSWLGSFVLGRRKVRANRQGLQLVAARQSSVDKYRQDTAGRLDPLRSGSVFGRPDIHGRGTHLHLGLFRYYRLWKYLPPRL